MAMRRGAGKGRISHSTEKMVMCRGAEEEAPDSKLSADSELEDHRRAIIFRGSFLVSCYPCRVGGAACRLFDKAGKRQGVFHHQEFLTNLLCLSDKRFYVII